MTAVMSSFDHLRDCLHRNIVILVPMLTQGAIGRRVQLILVAEMHVLWQAMLRSISSNSA